jgi:hypothetical protein
MARSILNVVSSDVGRPVDDITPNINVTDLEEQIGQVLDKLAAAPPPPARKPADVISARAATTAPASQPARTPIFVTGGKTYRREAGKIVAATSPQGSYAWALAHDVRPAQQALGARGCVECHAGGAPIFDSNVSSASTVSKASVVTPMHELRGDSIGALRAFGATYPLRWPLNWIGYASAAVLLLVLIRQAGNAMGGRGN